MSLSLYKTQSLITLVVETGYGSLGSATVKRINYERPNGTKGFFPGTVAGTTLTYAVQNGNIDQAGTWKFQSYIEVGGLKGFGKIATQYFDNPL